MFAVASGCTLGPMSPNSCSCATNDGWPYSRAGTVRPHSMVMVSVVEVEVCSSRSEVWVRNENCEGAAGMVMLVDEAVEVMVDETSVEVEMVDVLLGNEMMTELVLVIVLLAAVVVVVLFADTG